MARILVSKDWSLDTVDLGAVFQRLTSNMLLASESHLEVALADRPSGPDEVSGWSIALIGAGFTYAGKRVLSGDLKRVEVADADGSVVASLGGLSTDLGVFFHLLAERGRIDGFAAFQFLINRDDSYQGSKRADVIRGFSGNDSLSGRAGNDYAEPGSGTDVIEGGQGFDVLSYQDAASSALAFRGVRIDAEERTARDPWGSTDTFSGIEGFFGTHFRDEFRGSATGLEVFNPLRGRDFVDGGAGLDRIDYSSEHEAGGRRGILADLDLGTIRDTFGAVDRVVSVEQVRGSRFDDTIRGDANDNRLFGLRGDDVLDGRGGIDEADYSDDALFGGAGGVIVSLDDGSGTGSATDGFGSTDVLLSVENATGTGFADHLTGGIGSNFLAGGGGNDTLLGGAGDDLIVGGEGKDVIAGGQGRDTFLFAEVAVGDVLKDFALGADALDLEAVDADLSADADQAFAFIGRAAFSGSAGELRFARAPDGIVLKGDRDGDGKADFEIKLLGLALVGPGDMLL